MLVDLNLACLLLSTIPGLRTLISGFSVIGYSTREVKYITPGVDKGWRAKHEGLVLCFLALRVLTLITGTEHKMYGWDAISSVRRLWSPQVHNVCLIRAQIGLWPAPRGGYLIADAHAIKVTGYHALIGIGMD